MVGDDLFFRFGSFDEEISRKRRSGETPPEIMLNQLWQEIGIRPSTQDMNRFITIGRVLLGHLLKHGCPTYLNHPIRVAASFVAYLPDAKADDVVLALVHNLFERTDGIGIPEVNELAGPTVLSVVDLLTIDRTRERDQRYLSEYYAEIRKTGRSTVILKALDKLDNILDWTSRSVDPFYFEVIRSYVCSLLGEEDTRLRQYLEALESYVRARTPLWRPVSTDSRL